jgi:hypothetical protein
MSLEVGFRKTAHPQITQMIKTQPRNQKRKPKSQTRKPTYWISLIENFEVSTSVPSRGFIFSPAAVG